MTNTEIDLKALEQKSAALTAETHSTLDRMIAKAEGAPTQSAVGQPYCCEPSCDQPADFSIHTLRRGGIGGPDPYSDDTHACVTHVGDLLGHQVGAANPSEIYWEVHSVEAAQ